MATSDKVVLCFSLWGNCPFNACEIQGSNPSSMFIKSPLCTRHQEGHKKVHGVVPELRKHNINQENSFVTHCVKCQSPGGHRRVIWLWERLLKKPSQRTWGLSWGSRDWQDSVSYGTGRASCGDLSIGNSLVVRNLSWAGSLGNCTPLVDIHWILSTNQIWCQKYRFIYVYQQLWEKAWLFPFLDGEREMQRVSYFA